MASYIVLQDAGLNFWQWGVTTEGQMGTPTLGGTAVQNNFINDPSGATSWQLTISRQGAVTPTPVALNSAYPKAFNLIDPTGLTWPVKITVQGQIYVAASAGIQAMDWTPVEDAAQNYGETAARYKPSHFGWAYDEDVCAALVYPTIGKGVNKGIGSAIPILWELDSPPEGRNFDLCASSMVPPESELFSPVYPTVGTGNAGIGSSVPILWEADPDTTSRNFDLNVAALFQPESELFSPVYPTVTGAIPFLWELDPDTTSQNLDRAADAAVPADTSRARMFVPDDHNTVPQDFAAQMDWTSDYDWMQWRGYWVIEDEDVPAARPFFFFWDWAVDEFQSKSVDHQTRWVDRQVVADEDERVSTVTGVLSVSVEELHPPTMWIGFVDPSVAFKEEPGLLVPVFRPSPNIVMQDSLGRFWQIGITTVGQLTPPALGGLQVQNNFITDIITQTTTWQLTITTNGILVPVQVAYDHTIPTAINMIDSNGLTWSVDISPMGTLYVASVNGVLAMDWTTTTEDLSARDLTWRVIMQDDSDNDVKFRPATMFIVEAYDQDAIESKWVDWWVVADEDAPAARPFAVTVDWTQPQEDASQMWRDRWVVEDEDYYPPLAPFPLLTQLAWDDAGWERWLDRWTVTDEDEREIFNLRLPVLNLGWDQDAVESRWWGTWVVEDEDVTTALSRPFSPTADWSQANDDASQRWTGLWIVEDEDAPSAQPFAVVSDWTADYDSEQWRDTRVVEDEDEREIAWPIPLLVPAPIEVWLQDAEESKWFDWRVVEDEDSPAARPFFPVMGWDEVDWQHSVDWRVVEDEDERVMVFPVPQPPRVVIAYDQDAEESHSVDWRVIEDEDFYNPAPYHPVTWWDEVDWQRSVDTRVVVDEDEREILPVPPPPKVLIGYDQDARESRWTGIWVVEQEDERVIYPFTPTLAWDEVDWQRSVDYWVVEDEDALAPQPFIEAEDLTPVEDGAARWLDYCVIEDESAELAPAAFAPTMDWSPVEDTLTKSFDYRVVEDEDYVNASPFFPVLGWDEVDWQHSCGWWVVEDEDEREMAWPIPILIVPTELFIRRRTMRAWRLALSGTQTGA